VGLGNPGPAYQGTRHNVGQEVVDALVRRLGGRLDRPGGSPAGLVAEADFGGRRLALAKPPAFMNAVGPAVSRLMADLGVAPEALIVVHDDLDLAFGRVRTRLRGRAGGHNGVRSLIEALGTQEFRRVKVGIGRPPHKDGVVDWVLTGFAPEETDGLTAVVDRAATRVLELVAAWTGPLRHDIN
jgi:PTH1 family peptidyl-tRNA hydrolase